MMGGMAEWEYQHLYLPRGTSRGAARRLLTDHAEYGHWELDRLPLYADGSRRVVTARGSPRSGSTATAAGGSSSAAGSSASSAPPDRRPSWDYAGFVPGK